MSKEYQDKPIVFIGVNSGTSPASIAAYAKQVGITWPMIADPTRELERRVGFQEISLNNIKQVAYMTADGQVRKGNWTDVPGTISQALRGASWQVDPATIPNGLKNAWRAIEVGEFAMAARDITKSLKSGDQVTKQAAESLFAVVTTELKKDTASAWALGKAKDHYGAHVAMTQLQERFKGYEIPEKITSAAKWLEKQKSVTAEVAAQALLKEARTAIDSPITAVKKRAVSRLNNILKHHPDTQAAKEAKELLENATSR